MADIFGKKKAFIISTVISMVGYCLKWWGFDNDLNKIGNRVGTIKVKSINNLEKTINDNDINLGIVTVPADSAQEVVDKLVDYGIKAIWNFSPTRLYVPDDIFVRNEDLAVGIVSLIYHLSWQEEIEEKEMDKKGE
jgi:redox-sensing transcriptional repressor